MGKKWIPILVLAALISSQSFAYTLIEIPQTVSATRSAVQRMLRLKEIQKRGYAKVSVLVLYTAAAKVQAGGQSAIQTQVNLAIQDTQQALLNSKAKAQLSMVGLQEVAFQEQRGLLANLQALEKPGPGKSDEIQVLRDRLQADLVILIVSALAQSFGDALEAGLSNTMHGDPIKFKSLAYGVVSQAEMTLNPYTHFKNYVLAHEIGHLLGCGHQKSFGYFKDSLGFIMPHAPDPMFGDVDVFDVGDLMATGVDFNVPYYSNPDVSYRGVPTGVAGTNDCVRAINATTPWIETFY